MHGSLVIWSKSPKTILTLDQSLPLTFRLCYDMIPTVYPSFSAPAMLNCTTSRAGQTCSHLRTLYLLGFSFFLEISSPSQVHSSFASLHQAFLQMSPFQQVLPWAWQIKCTPHAQPTKKANRKATSLPFPMYRSLFMNFLFQSNIISARSEICMSLYCKQHLGQCLACNRELSE